MLTDLAVSGMKSMWNKVSIFGHYLEVSIELRPGHNVTFTTDHAINDNEVFRFPGEWTVPGGSKQSAQRERRVSKGFRSSGVQSQDLSGICHSHPIPVPLGHPISDRHAMECTMQCLPVIETEGWLVGIRTPPNTGHWAGTDF